LKYIHIQVATNSSKA